MKKLMIMALLAAFAVGCTATSVEEDYEIQIIDKKDSERPGKQGNCGQEQQEQQQQGRGS